MKHPVHVRPRLSLAACAVAAGLAFPPAIAVAHPQGSATPSPPGQAQGASATVSTASEASTRPQGRDQRATQLIGKDVRNAQGEDLGRIEDLIVDVANDRLVYAILSFGGVLGLGDKLFAYPVEFFDNAGGSDKLVLKVAKEALKDAPGFDRQRWPDFGQRTYRDQIERYFGTSTPASPRIAPGQRLTRATTLLDKDVKDRQGREVGEIEDMVVNITSGRVRYVVLDFDKAWSPNDKLVSLPMKALIVPRTVKNDLVLNVDTGRMDATGGFDDDRWPDLNDPAWRQANEQRLERMQPDAASAAPAQP